MSKPRSKLINYTAREFRNVRGFTTALHFGRQAKHMPGHTNHQPTKSTITISITELQHLVELTAGTGTWRGTNREIVDFGITIGRYLDSETETSVPSTRGTIHYSKHGAHVVPTAPHERKKREPKA